jgi:hypothetical protein
MFAETITAPRSDWERWRQRLRAESDPPAALVVSVTWDAGDGLVTTLNVWDTPEAIADFYMERVRPIVEAEGEPAEGPRRHGPPLAFYLRP